MSHALACQGFPLARSCSRSAPRKRVLTSQGFKRRRWLPSPETDAGCGRHWRDSHHRRHPCAHQSRSDVRGVGRCPRFHHAWQPSGDVGACGAYERGNSHVYEYVPWTAATTSQFTRGAASGAASGSAPATPSTAAMAVGVHRGRRSHLGSYHRNGTQQRDAATCSGFEHWAKAMGDGRALYRLPVHADIHIPCRRWEPHCVDRNANQLHEQLYSIHVQERWLSVDTGGQSRQHLKRHQPDLHSARRLRGVPHYRGGGHQLRHQRASVQVVRALRNDHKMAP